MLGEICGGSGSCLEHDDGDAMNEEKEGGDGGCSEQTRVSLVPRGFEKLAHSCFFDVDSDDDGREKAAKSIFKCGICLTTEPVIAVSPFGLQHEFCKEGQAACTFCLKCIRRWCEDHIQEKKCPICRRYFENYCVISAGSNKAAPT